VLMLFIAVSDQSSDVLYILLQVDYVRLHGYEFHLFTSVVDKSLTKLCVACTFAQSVCISAEKALQSGLPEDCAPARLPALCRARHPPRCRGF